MFINTAGISMLYDMFQNTSFKAINKAGEEIIGRDEWNLFWRTQNSELGKYLNKNSGEAFYKDVTIRVLDLMNFVTRYIRGEFDYKNASKDLRRVWAPLIKACYFEHVWVIKSEEVMKLEIAMAESEQYRDSISEQKLLRGNPYRLFQKTGIKNNGNYLFKSVLTGISNFELDPKEMVYLSLSEEGSNFRIWWEINLDYIAGLSRGTDALKSLSKTVRVNVKNKDSYLKEREQLQNTSTLLETYKVTGQTTEQNQYNVMPMFDGQRLRDIEDSVQARYQNRCAQMGITMNANDKRERLTVAENYKDLRQITNLQDDYLKQLKIFEEDLKDKNWEKEDFEIYISGLTYAQGVPNANVPKTGPTDKQAPLTEPKDAGGET